MASKPVRFTEILYDMVNGSDNEFIGWVEGSNSIEIYDRKRFVETLPVKHFSNFQRQLNLYGFKKDSISGQDKISQSSSVWQSPFFGRDRSAVRSFKRCYITRHRRASKIGIAHKRMDSAPQDNVPLNASVFAKVQHPSCGDSQQEYSFFDQLSFSPLGMTTHESFIIGDLQPSSPQLGHPGFFERYRLSPCSSPVSSFFEQPLPASDVSFGGVQQLPFCVDGIFKGTSAWVQSPGGGAAEQEAVRDLVSLTVQVPTEDDDMWLSLSISGFLSCVAPSLRNAGESFRLEQELNHPLVERSSSPASELRVIVRRIVQEQQKRAGTALLFEVLHFIIASE